MFNWMFNEIHKTSILEFFVTLNNIMFPGSGLQIKVYYFLAAGITFQMSAIFSMHHRHLHAITGTSSCFLKNPSSF